MMEVNMYDLIYGGNEYKEELKALFPNAKFEDASDEVHEDRISIEIDDNVFDEKDYWKKICLNGFLELSLGVKMAALENQKEFKEEFEKWKKESPELFV
jgi:hypothetical protein